VGELSDNPILDQVCRKCCRDMARNGNNERGYFGKIAAFLDNDAPELDFNIVPQLDIFRVSESLEDFGHC
jgi:hypothetical protein